MPKKKNSTDRNKLKINKKPKKKISQSYKGKGTRGTTKLLPINADSNVSLRARVRHAMLRERTPQEKKLDNDPVLKRLKNIERSLDSLRAPRTRLKGIKK